MKKILLIIATFSLGLGAELLQDGIYPECSYVVVTADGWRIHKNYQGRVLSMKAPNLHDTKIGKYSFDKFGNLIPYTTCETIEMGNEQEGTKVSENKKSEVNIDLKFDFSNFISVFKNPKFSVKGGLTMPLGDNLTTTSNNYPWDGNGTPGSSGYGMGYHYGFDIKPNFSGILKNISFSFVGLNLAHDDKIKSSLTSTGFFTNYTLNMKKLYLVGGVGTINQEGILFWGEDSKGTDMGIVCGGGLNLGKISLYGEGIYTTTFLGKEQIATFINFGLKYNF